MKPLLIITLLFFSTSTLFAQIFGRSYNPGAYYTSDGQKHVGLLAMDYDPPSIFSSHSDNTLFFKPDTGGHRQKIKASTIMAFVVTNKDTARTDSFVIVHQIERSRIKYEYDFIQVVMDKGPVKVYDYKLQRHVGMGFGAGALMLGASVAYFDNYYFYGETADKSVEIRRKEFKDVMSKILADSPDLVAKIQTKDYTLGDMHTVLDLYNTQHPGAGAPASATPSGPPPPPPPVVKD